MGRILTFTNLFPSAADPTHGLFVQDRMSRVAKHTGFDWRIVSPVPFVPWPLARGGGRACAARPERELVAGVQVCRPRYLHLPGISLAAQAGRMARAALPVVRAVAAGERTVLDAHYLYPDGVAALWVAERLDLPCILTARGSDVNVLANKSAVRSQLRRSLPRAAALLAVSRALGQGLATFAGLAEGEVRIARNGVDLDRFRLGQAPAARARLGLPQLGPLVLGVGRLIEAKGFWRLAAVIRELPGVRLVLVGEGPERRRLQRLLGERLHLLGVLTGDALVSAYQACDLLALLSRAEGWPNVVTEALACGLPVVATAVGGVPEILTDPIAGACLADPTAAGVAIRRLLAEPPERRAVRAFAARYSWEEPIAMLAALFGELLA